MPVGFPPIPLYPLGIDSDSTLYLVYNTTESVITADNLAWSDEILIEPQPADEPEIWPENGFATISGELFYYDAVTKNENDRIYKLRKCARNLGGKHTQFNKSGTDIRGFVVAEHHEQLSAAVTKIETFLGTQDSADPNSLDYRIRQIADQSDCFDDGNCPSVSFNYEVVSADPCDGTLISYDLTVDGSFNTFKLEFGDGNFTTSVQSGEHRYAPNSVIDPVVFVGNNFCQLVITGVERSEDKQPESPVDPNPLVIEISNFPVVPTINIQDLDIPETDITFPPFVMPCIDLEPSNLSIGGISIGDISVPSIISIVPPEIPSVISVIPPSISPISIVGIDLPSVISISGPEIPSLISIQDPDIPSIISFSIPSIPSMISIQSPEFPSIISGVFPDISIIPPSMSDISLVVPSIPSFISLIPNIPSIISVDGPNIRDISIIGTVPSSISIDGTIPSVISFGPAPQLSVTWGTPPPLAVDWGTPPSIQVIDSIPTNITVNDSIPNTIIVLDDIPNIITVIPPTIPPITVNWGTPPAISCSCVIGCCSSTTAPLMAANTDSLWAEDYDINADLTTLNVDYNFGESTPKVMLEVPDIPNISIETDRIPSKIRVAGMKIPSKIDIVADNIPQEIKLSIPEVLLQPLKLDIAGSIPSEISLVAPIIPSIISIDGTSIPDVIKVEGIPSVLQVGGFPDFIPLSITNPEVEMVYKGAPIEVVVKIDMQDVIGTTDDGSQCVRIVPCPK